MEQRTQKGSLSTILLLGFALTACQKKGEPQDNGEQIPNQEETEQTDVIEQPDESTETETPSEETSTEDATGEETEAEKEEKEAEEKPPAFDPDMTVKPLYGVDVIE